MKFYDQKQRVDYAEYKVGLFYILPFGLFVEGEAIIAKPERKESGSVRESGSKNSFVTAVTTANAKIGSE